MPPTAPAIPHAPPQRPDAAGLKAELGRFDAFGKRTQVRRTDVAGLGIETFVNEFWTARQRAAHSLHEVSYRACFKPQLPRFFIERLSAPGDAVFDPFAGRGTTLLEAALLGRVPLGCDINPLSAVLSLPRLQPPHLEQIRRRLDAIDLRPAPDAERPDDLLTFYHPQTLDQLCALRSYFLRRAADDALDGVDCWLRTVAVNRLTGHSSGFFSVYTLPPNQAVSVVSQRRINARRRQQPPPRDVKAILFKKSRTLLKDCTDQTRRLLADVAPQARLLTASCESVPQIADASVALVVTSPPFLDVVNYAQDNWLRCWFCGIDSDQVPISMLRKLEDWRAFMSRVFTELHRVLVPGGHVAFEVGEVRHGKIKLEEEAIPCGIAAGFTPLLVLINDQTFTKTANVWGVANGKKGTNTNRIVVFQK